MRKGLWLLCVLFISTGLSGCVTVADVNTAFRRVDLAWQLDYQKTEDEYRWRVIEADKTTVYQAVRSTLIDLGMPIQIESLEKLTLVAHNLAPLPLTIEEWKEVVKQENPQYA